MKRYVWGFPGIGKSSLNIPGLRAVDADCKLYEFQDVSAADLHNSAVIKHFERNEDYPQNYLDFIRSVDADVVFVNCHISLLEQLDKDDILLVYPCEELIKDYLVRYRQRGDNETFVSYMSSEAAHIIQHIENSDFEKYPVSEKGVFMTDLFERNDFNMKLMTRKELTEQLQRAKDLDLLGFDEEQQMLVCDIKFLNDASVYGILAETLADDVFNGKYSLDIDQLVKVCEAREAELKKEREKLVAHFQRAIDLNVFSVDVANKTIVCDLSMASGENLGAELYDAYDLADDVMSGKYTVDIDKLKAVCKEREAQLEELKLADARGGLSRKELADKIMQGIVNGALGISHGQIAPYSYGYEVTLGRDGVELGSTRNFINRWECYCDLFDVPATIVGMIERGHQDGVFRGADYEKFDIKRMLFAIDEAEKHKITSFVPEKESGFERRGRYSGHVATVKDVHYGRALDGIVQHHFHGDYSSITTGNYNSLVEALVFMKGFCLDCLDGVSGGAERRKNIVEYLKEHGTDVSTPEKLQAWINANPDKCGKEEFRVIKRFNNLSDLIAEGEAKKSDGVSRTTNDCERGERS